MRRKGPRRNKGTMADDHKKRVDGEHTRATQAQESDGCNTNGRRSAEHEEEEEEGVKKM